MTTGALIFAHNNAVVDYVKLAIFAANRVIQHLNIPVSIITDNADYLREKYPEHPFEQIIETHCDQSTSKFFYDGSLSSRELEWKNLTRTRAYDLSPYDTTMVLDSDYIINSPLLKIALSRDEDLQIYQQSLDLAHWRDQGYCQRINQYSIPFYWATVFVFKKNLITRAFFDLISYIKLNYQYFRTLYGISDRAFRNDFAFSIAIHIMNGKTNGKFATPLPGKIVYSNDRDLLISAKNNSMKFLVEKEHHLGEYIAAKTDGLDVHVMNKMSLSRIIDGGADV